ncbi:threonine/serine exporter family protein [Mycolicibacterium arenosum]|uniref:Threonine/serine exporter family protein n=1 Tax=Mycolicibacterium arenosum TaxID=2952157 RepID=A0ABT1LWM5_9MYCO|nr:threonine/serine exporter family protein [Mycolicibacterium sp. CAU 1645]MCP9271288.1 threonine/serine exporter family protein [Mycolicibacterium sp. CAU 1645]
MTDDRGERYDALLAAASLLFANGQSTAMTQTAVARLNRGLDLDAVVVPTWSMLTLTAAGSRTTVLTSAVSPTAINMRRVAAMMSVADRAQDGPLELEHVTAGVAKAERQPGSGTTAFVIACAAGAAALSVIYGADQPLVLLLVAVAAAGGGLLRRWLGAAGAGPLTQAFGAALLAGGVGAAATHAGLGTAAALVAICPAMVLVPGPHILNGALDMLDLRVPLGLARLAFGLLLLTAISGGLIVGLHAGGQTLAVTAQSSSAPFLVDVVAAGVAAASYPVFFSMPWRMIGWPVAAGMLAHGVHWLAVAAGASLAIAAFASCLLVGTLLVPISHRMRIPFAGIGFAAVVALVPGVFVFRTLAGFVEFAGAPSAELLSASAGDLIGASVIVAAMALGLALPMHVHAAMLRRRHAAA